MHGKQFYNTLNFKKDARGKNGVVSLEITFIEIVGSAVISIIFTIGYGCYYRFCWIIIAGKIGNYTDSFLVATLERKQILQNDVVNFINTLAGAFTAYVLIKSFLVALLLSFILLQFKLNNFCENQSTKYHSVSEYSSIF